MKQSFVFALAMAFVTACSTAPRRQNHTSSETVLVTYRVKPGKEQQLAATLSRAWDIYRKERLVFAQPHVIIREREEGDKHRFKHSLGHQRVQVHFQIRRSVGVGGVGDVWVVE